MTSQQPYGKRPPDTRGSSPVDPGSFDATPFDSVEAFKWAFEVYQGNVFRVVLPIVTLETVFLFAGWIVPRILGSTLRVVLPDSGSWIASLIQYLTGAGLGIVSTACAVACLYPYLLNLARGRSVEPTDAFRLGPNLKNSLILVAVLSVALSLGLSLCVLPGVALMALSAPAFPAIADRNLDAMTTIRECIDHAQRHFLPILFFGLLSAAITLAGMALCAVGAIFVSVPIVMMAQTYVYLRLRGEVPVGTN